MFQPEIFYGMLCWYSRGQGASPPMHTSRIPPWKRLPRRSRDIVVNTTTLFEERAFFPIATYSIPDYIAGDEAASCGNCNVNTVRVALKTYTGKVFEPGLRIGPASTTWVKHGWLLTLKPIPSPDVLGNLLGVKLYTEDFFVCAMSNSRENTKRRSDCLFLNARGRRH